MFRRSRILVVGRGGMARRIAARLQEGGRPCMRVDDLAGIDLRRGSLRTLILADTDLDPDRFPVGIRAAFGATPDAAGTRRRRPLRLILACGPGAQTMVPAVPDDLDLAVETFDLEAEAARALLARWPLHAGMDPPYGQVPHALIAGLEPPAPALLRQILRLAHYGGEAPPVVTLACRDAREADRMRATSAQAEHICRLRFTDVEDPDLTRTPPVTSAFVCLRPPERGLAVARRLAARIAQVQGASPRIHLDVGDETPAGRLIEWDGQIFPFSWPNDVLGPDILLDRRGDELARTIHEHYRDSIAAQGRDPDSEPAGRPWEGLDDSYRDASRHQADHLAAKLAILDCRAVPEELVETFRFAPLEAERLAAVEHRRWAADRYLDGWTWAEKRDNARKHHPQLIPYADLSEPMKDLDRFAVRLAPTLLARSGRALLRLLVIALPEPAVECRPDRRLRRLVDRALGRLAARYPDLGLVFAATLEGPATRFVVRRALEGIGAGWVSGWGAGTGAGASRPGREIGLFLLCPRPLAETLAAQPDDRDRHDLLELVARAERRIALPAATEGGGDPEAWFAGRAHIRIELGAASAAGAPAKRVLLEPAANRLTFGFEY